MSIALALLISLIDIPILRKTNEIVVPEQTEVDSKTGSGSQNIGNVQGPVSAASGSGSLSR